MRRFILRRFHVVDDRAESKGEDSALMLELVTGVLLVL